jgi:hypothetical protein
MKKEICDRCGVELNEENKLTYCLELFEGSISFSDVDLCLSCTASLKDLLVKFEKKENERV